MIDEDNNDEAVEQLYGHDDRLDDDEEEDEENEEDEEDEENEEDEEDEKNEEDEEDEQDMEFFLSVGDASVKSISVEITFAENIS